MREEIGAAAFLPPTGSGGFLAADQGGVGGTESPHYTSRPLHFPATESHSNTEEQATRKSLLPVGDEKVAPPAMR